MHYHFDTVCRAPCCRGACFVGSMQRFFVRTRIQRIESARGDYSKVHKAMLVTGEQILCRNIDDV